LEDFGASHFSLPFSTSFWLQPLASGTSKKVMMKVKKPSMLHQSELLFGELSDTISDRSLWDHLFLPPLGSSVSASGLLPNKPRKPELSLNLPRK